MMDRFPAELLSIVCKNCDVSALRAFRLLNKTCSSLATPILFKEVYVCYLPSSFDKLHAISTSSLSGYVQSLVYLADLLPKFYDRSDWWSRLEDIRLENHSRLVRPEDFHPDELLSDSAKERSFDAYRRFYHQQQYLLDDYVDQATLTATLCRLGNLKYVDIRRTQHRRRGERWRICHPTWQCVYEETLYPTGCLDDQDVDTLDFGRLVKAALLALSISRARIHKLEITGLGREVDAFAWLEEAHYQVFAPAFQHLRYIRLELNYYIDSEDDGYKRTASTVEVASRWLRNAELLEELDIDFVQNIEEILYDEDLPTQPDILGELSDMKWPNLRSMRFHNLFTTEDTLLRLIHNQSALVDLELHYINLKLVRPHLNGGSWRSFIRRLSQTTGPQLRNAILADVSDNEYVSLLSGYLNEELEDVSRFIRFGGEFPELTDMESSSER